MRATPFLLAPDFGLRRAVSGLQVFDEILAQNKFFAADAKNLQAAPTGAKHPPGADPQPLTKFAERIELFGGDRAGHFFSVGLTHIS